MAKATRLMFTLGVFVWRYVQTVGLTLTAVSIALFSLVLACIRCRLLRTQERWFSVIPVSFSTVRQAPLSPYNSGMCGVIGLRIDDVLN